MKIKKTAVAGTLESLPAMTMVTAVVSAEKQTAGIYIDTGII